MRSRGRGPAPSILLKLLGFVTVTGLLTFFIGAQILGAGFDRRYKLTATFDDVTGLLENDAVKVAGVPMGQVTSIEVRQGKAVVEMSVDREVRIPDDSTAAIRWRNVTGQRVVYLEPGRSRTMLRDGGRVPRTRSVVDLNELVNSLGPLTRSLDPNQINKLLFAFTQTLGGNERNINLMIQHLDVLLQTFNSRRDTVREMIDNYETVGAAIATRDEQIAASVGNLRELTEVFAGNHRMLENTVVKVAGATTDLDQILGGNEAQLSRIIGNLADLSETFRLNVDELEKLVQHLPRAMRALFSTVNGGEFLRSNELCVTVLPGPCPYPMRLPSSRSEGPTPQELALLRSMLGRGGR